MALKYGSKPSGFGLRSGNKKGMPFKQMGSTPAQYKGVSPMNKLDDPSTGDQSSFIDDVDDKKTNIEKFREGTYEAIDPKDGKMKTWKIGEGPRSSEEESSEQKSSTGKEAVAEVTDNFSKSLDPDDDTSLPDNVETKDDSKKKEKKNIFRRIGDELKKDSTKKILNEWAATLATDPSKRQMYLQRAKQYEKPAELTEEEKKEAAHRDDKRKITELTLKQKQQELDETTKTTAKRNDPTKEQVKIATRDNTKGLSQEEIDLIVSERQAKREKEMDTKYGYLDTETGKWVPGTFGEEQKTTE